MFQLNYTDNESQISWCKGYLFHKVCQWDMIFLTHQIVTKTILYGYFIHANKGVQHIWCMASGVLLASWVFSSTIKNVGQVHLNTFFAPFQFIFRMKTNAFYQSFCESAKKQCFQNSIRISLCKLPFVKLNITHVKHVFSELFFAILHRYSLLIRWYKS